MSRLLGLILIFSINCSVFGQTQEEIIQQELQNREQARRAEVARTIENGVSLMDEGDHEGAEAIFKEVLKNAKVVPTDLTFYFGKNSYHLGRYQQSIDWLNKYIELKGTKGQFYEECTEYLTNANEAFLLVRAEEREEAKRILTSSYDIDCGPSGKVICPVCMGKGVIIEQKAFGNSYRTCPYSDEHGYLTCSEYNQLLRGELKPKF